MSKRVVEITLEKILRDIGNLEAEVSVLKTKVEKLEKTIQELLKKFENLEKGR